MPRLADLQKRFHLHPHATADQIADETLILDARANTRPAQLVESKFLMLLGRAGSSATNELSKRPRPR